MKALTNVYTATQQTSHHFNLKTYGVVVKNKYLEQKKNSKWKILREIPVPTVKEVNPKERQEKIQMTGEVLRLIREGIIMSRKDTGSNVKQK